MCKNKITNISTSHFILNTLIKMGVTKVCISPGSRNTPLTQTFINNKKIKCYSLIDERSSAYFALGLIKSSNKPVAVLTTSGTAATNLLPATVEASLNKLPLFLLTADRPKKLINTGASQTINQLELFNNYIRKMTDIDIASESIEKQLESLNVILSYGMGTKTNPPGPIHLNIRFDEPLIDKNHKISIKDIKQKKESIKYKSIKFPKFSTPLIVCGPLNGNANTDSIIKLSKKINAPILADSLSQLRFNRINHNIFTHYDVYIKKLKNRPDLILRFGDKPISKNLNNYIKEHSNITYLIDKHAGFNDDCKNKIISNYKNLDNIKSNNQKNILFNELTDFETKACMIINKNINKSKSQATIVKKILSGMNNNDQVFVGSSTMIRTFDLFMSSSSTKLKILSNHITRGIDGTVSSALGMASDNNKTNNYLFIGDISFFYDLNGLHILNHHKINLNIIVINNNGGQIFSRLPYSNHKINHFDEFWITPLQTKIKDAAKLYNINYYKGSNNNISKIINKANTTRGVNMIEIEINNTVDIKSIKNIINQILI